MLPPPHPSLPQPPSPQQPYATYYNSHYVQAYSQSISNAAHCPIASSSNQSSQKSNFPMQSCSSWYQPGTSRCSYPACTFTGSSKSVEIHMMDRHLIYPSGWEKRQKKRDWDADPSLKGKPIPIQGTNIVLDSPEILEAWIAERKKRFPTSDRIENKKRKMQEAVARGQLDLTEAGLANKRRKVERIDSYPKRRQGQPTKGHPRIGRDSEKARVLDSGWPARAPKSSLQLVERLVSPSACSETGSCSEAEDNEAPECRSSKIDTAYPIALQHCVEIDVYDQACSAATAVGSKEVRNFKQKHIQQPKPPLRNPFASRPTLLRNLLLPEIRVTISNLSQAIRFLVDNHFLHNVELKPGQAVEQNKIQFLTLDGDEKQVSSV